MGNRKLSRVINSKEVVMFLDATYRAIDDKASFGLMAMLKGVVVDASAWIGPKVTSSKEVEERALLAALKKGEGTMLCKDLNILGH